MLENLIILENEIDGLVDTIVEKVSTEYAEYKEMMLKKSAAEVYDESYRTSGYYDMSEYFENSGFSEMVMCHSENKTEAGMVEIFNRLREFSEKNILRYLYEMHFKYEGLYLNSWDDINELVKEVVFYRD